ncbi:MULTISPECIES: hypothetical protein [unclassified Streptomyces]|uniref:hypothetical protein n=1 Tax=unclassified Streptomyces TaxID=2593676 RepID=UPI00336A0391
MIPPAALASPDEIRDYLVDRLNLALRRPGMMGGELGLRLLLDHLLFVERREEAWAEERRAMEERGAWTATGVVGAFRSLLPGDHGHETASVYAEFARRAGWLEADRVLDAEAYASMRGRIAEWVRQDRGWADVVAAFGPPSVLFGSTNPLYGKTLGYLTARAEDPMVFFHLWNGTAPEAASSWPPDYDEPLLLAVRCGMERFADTFTFTPHGQALRPPPGQELP